MDGNWALSSRLGAAKGREKAATRYRTTPPSLTYTAESVRQRCIPCLQELLHNYWLSPDRYRSLPVGSVPSRCTTRRHLVRTLRRRTASHLRRRRLHVQHTHTRYTHVCIDDQHREMTAGNRTGGRSGQQRWTHPNRLNACPTSPSASGSNCTQRNRRHQSKDAVPICMQGRRAPAGPGWRSFAQLAATSSATAHDHAHIQPLVTLQHVKCVTMVGRRCVFRKHRVLL